VLHPCDSYTVLLIISGPLRFAFKLMKKACYNLKIRTICAYYFILLDSIYISFACGSGVYVADVS
jgi:hypothetical protein